MLKKFLLSIFCLFLLLIFLLLAALFCAPGIGLYFAADWYAKQGEGYQLTAHDWHFSPFKTELILEGVVLHHPQKGFGESKIDRLSLLFDPYALFEKRVAVQNIELDGVDLAVKASLEGEQKELFVAGIVLPLNAEESAAQPVSSYPESLPWTVSVDKITVKNHEYKWLAELSGLKTTGALDIKEIVFSDFALSAQSEPKVTATLNLKKLNLSGPAEIELKNSLTVMVNGKLQNLLTEPTFQGNALIQNLDITAQQFDLQFKQLDVKNIFANASKQSIGEVLLTETTALNNQDLSASVSRILLKNIVNNGAQSIAKVEINNVQVIQGDQLLQLEQLQAQELLNKDGQSLKQLQLSRISLVNQQGLDLGLGILTVDNAQQREKVSQLQQLQLNDLRIGNSEQPLAKLQHYELQDLLADLSQPELKVNVGKQGYWGLSLDAKLDKSGQLVGMPLAQTSDQTPPTAEINEDVKPLLLAAALVGLQQLVAENAQSRINIEDNSITPALNSFVEIKQLDLGQLGFKLKENGIELNKKSPIQIELTLGKYSNIKLIGELGLFERGGEFYPEGNLKVTVRQLDLVPFNGYIIKALGYQVDRGTLDVDAVMTFQKAQLGGEVNLLLRNSKFSPKDEETIKKVSAMISMPLDTAVGLLRDKNGNLKLNIPLTGDLSAPDIGLNDITKQLTQKALKASTVFFLKQALQPYGTMITVAGFAGDYLFAIRLDSLFYEQGVSELSEEQMANLQKVAELMEKKKDIEVRACPFVSTDELAELGEDKWAKLANARGTIIKDWFVANHEEVSNRMSVCRPQKGEKAEVVLGVN
ncbi:MAG: DUF748 domain-containing protein [Venatoribacter sp.]